MNRIIYTNEDGGVSIIIPTESVELALKDIPKGVSYEVVSEDAIPSDRFFRNAWAMKDGRVEQDLKKCKAIAHDLRRQKRDKEFAPYDNVIAKQIPGADLTAAETARQEIRDRYDMLQDAIDAASTPQQIKATLESI